MPRSVHLDHTNRAIDGPHTITLNDHYYDDYGDAVSQFERMMLLPVITCTCSPGSAPVPQFTSISSNDGLRARSHIRCAALCVKKNIFFVSTSSLILARYSQLARGIPYINIHRLVCS